MPEQNSRENPVPGIPSLLEPPGFDPIWRMSEVTPSNTTSSVKRPWKDDSIFSELSDPVRQQIVSRLARGERMTANELGAGTGLKRPAFQRYLSSMLKAGILVQEDYPKDRRQSVYLLSPAAVVCETAEFISVDFDCYMLRFPKT